MEEFWNNIWIAISTPNKPLVDFFSIPMLCVEIPLSLYLIISFLNLKTNKNQNLLYIAIMIFVGVISRYFLGNPFNIIFNLCASLIVTHFVLKASAFKTIVATVLPSIVFVIFDSLLFNPYITLLNITSEQALSIFMYKIPINLFIYILIFIITFIIKNNKLSIKLDDVDKKSKSLLIFNLSFGLIYIGLEVIITIGYIDTLPLSYTFANFIMLFLYFSISFYSISKVSKLVKTTRKLESVEEYNKTLRILHDSVRGFKHDFDNIVTTIGGYINTDDMAGLKNYYVQLQHDCEKVNNLYILNPDSINNPRYL